MKKNYDVGEGVRIVPKKCYLLFEWPLVTPAHLFNQYQLIFKVKIFNVKMNKDRKYKQ
jgi:hypothetical protein